MKDLREKRFTVVFLLTAAIMAVQITDVFFIKSNETIIGDTVVARVLGLIMLVAASKMLRFNLKRRCLNSFGCVFELLYGVGFSLAPIVVIYAAEFIYFKLKGFYHEVSISLNPPNSAGGGVLISLTVYIVALLINVFFKELYRGFMLNQLCRKFGANKSNFIQAVIFTLMSGIVAIKALFDGKFENCAAADVAITVTASALTVLISSLRWGYYYKVNGSVWMAVADHFVNMVITTSVYFSNDRLPDKWLLVTALVIQIISCVIFIPFYYKRDRVNAEYAKEMKTSHDVLSAMNESSESTDAKTASNNFLMAMNETEQVKKFGNIRENEILDFDREPKAYTKKFGPSYADKNESVKNTEKKTESENSHGKKRRLRSTENVPENAESISKLVDEYFKKQFDKSTYN